MKRVLLFLITNLAVVFVLSIAMRLLGLDQYIAAQGGSAYGLLVFAAVFGFGGAIISPSVAITLASAQRPGTQPHEVELDMEDSGIRWEVEMVAPNGTVYVVIISAS